MNQPILSGRVVLVLSLCFLSLFLLSQSTELTSYILTETELETSLDNTAAWSGSSVLQLAEDNNDENEDEDDGESEETKARFYVNEFNETVKIWQWSRAKHNMLYIKIPKTGGTTLAENLARLAKHSHWVMAKPNDRSKVSTCGPQNEAEQAWSYMVIANGGKIGAFGSHACYRPFMKNKRYWSLRRTPTLITLVRHPWDHFISKYRFAQVCCEMKNWKWCDDFCPKDLNGMRAKMTHTRYGEIACKNGRCNEQRFYMGSGATDKILEEYKLILILERFDESLALLAVKLGLPFQALPYLRENTNNMVKMPNFTLEYRKQVQSKHLNYDMDIYHASLTRFDAQLNNLDDAEKVRYNETYSRLVLVNAQMNETCHQQCGMYQQLTRTRKLCDNACIERVLDELD